MKKYILVIGGAGYIGSHMVRTLIDSGLSPVVLDNLSTGHRGFVPSKVPLVRGNLKDHKLLTRVFKKYSVGCVMHFAAFSLVGESVRHPLKYYDNNVASFLILSRAMVEAGVRRIIFSSSAAVYGEPKKTPIMEDCRLNPVNPYGHTKLIIEDVLKALSDQGKLEYVSLRYFNACGAHASGEIGEKHDPETHLIPNILKAIGRKAQKITVFGDDYPTKDGTCVRDYVHVEDICDAHLKALKFLESKGRSCIINLGMGKGYTVKDVIAAAEKITGRSVPYVIGPRRSGDPVSLVASCGKAKRVLGWRPSMDLEDIVRSAWNWEQRQ